MASAQSRPLPEPLTDNWDWQLDARCRHLDSDLFFPCEDEGRGARIRRERVAKRICEPFMRGMRRTSTRQHAMQGQRRPLKSNAEAKTASSLKTTRRFEIT